MLSESRIVKDLRRNPYPAVDGICIRRRLHGRLIKYARGRRDLLALADLLGEREDGGAAGEGALLAARLAEGREPHCT